MNSLLLLTVTESKDTDNLQFKTYKHRFIIELEDGEARSRRKERQLIDGRPSNAAKCC